MASVYSPRWVAPEKPKHQQCDMPDCKHEGEFRAPKSRYSPIAKDYYQFCLNHVSQYNKEWNYFDGMSDMEVEIYWEDLDIDHRPTWKREGGQAFTAENLRKAFNDKFGGIFHGESIEELADRLPAPNRKIEQGLRILDLKWPVTAEQIKKKYKQLVKIYHPDITNEAGAEDKFKQITEAYAVIMNEMAV